MNTLYFFAPLIQIIQSSVAPYLQIMLRNSGYSHTIVGTIMGVGLLLSVAGPLILSSISQKSGRPRLVIILTAAAIVIFFAPVLYPVSTVVTIICYSLGFVCLCSINPLQDSYINSIIPDPSYYGRIRACGTIAYVAVLFISAFLAFPNQESNTSIFINMAVKVAVFVVFCLVFLKADGAETASSSNEKVSIFSLGSVFYLFIFLFALTRIAHGVVEKLLASYMTETMGLGTSFTFYIALGALFEALIMVVLGKKTGRGPSVCLNMTILSSAFVTVRLLIYYFFPNSIFMFSAAQALHGLTYGMAHISATAYIANLLGKKNFTIGMGVYQALGYNLPEMIAVTVGGVVIDNFGYPVLFVSYSVLPVIAVLLMIAFRKKLLSF
ncbi:MAG: MFS transporter [Sphaerochaetaceae bacterium]|nr:MFS transporter [Sphaerochaetaceae bacterium]